MRGFWHREKDVSSREGTLYFELDFFLYNYLYGICLALWLHSNKRCNLFIYLFYLSVLESVSWYPQLVEGLFPSAIFLKTR